MRLERRLDDHLGAYLALEQAEFLVLSEALGSVHLFSLDLKGLVPDDKRYRPI